MFLIVFFFISVNLCGQGLVLKPAPVRDDTFSARIDSWDLAKVSLEPWVSFTKNFWNVEFLEPYSFHLTRYRPVDFRVFQVREGTSFESLVDGIEKLKSLGFRPTSLRHVIAFANTANAKHLAPGVIVLSTSQPFVKSQGFTGKMEGFYAALSLGDSLLVGTVDKEHLKNFKVQVVIFEPPLDTH